MASAEAEPVEESMILERRVRIDRVRRGHAAPAGRGRRAIWAVAAVLASLHGSVNTRAAAQDDTEVTPRIAAAAERGLAWLSEKQLPSGGWAADVGYKLRQDYQIRESGTEHVGVTALAGMAFLAGGNLPDRGPYGDELARAVDYLLSKVGELGFVTANYTRMYSHAFATLFLAEVYGTTQLEELRPKLQRAVDLIVASQNDKGSWRYEPFVTESDMSITVCQLMALRAARNVGIRVPASTIELAVSYVQRSLVRSNDFGAFGRGWGRGPGPSYYFNKPGCFQYQVDDDQRSSFALTAAGVVSLYHAGHYDARALRASLNVLEEARETLSRGWVGHYFYWYGHYYAVQAAFLTGDSGDREVGPYWRRYWKHTSEELLNVQRDDGSWPNSVGPGPAFGTAVACIILQTPYRYLPILQR